MTTLETSLPLYVLLPGIVLSILLFLWLFHREKKEVKTVTAIALMFLRSALCILLWLVIAQPKIIQTSTKTIPISTRLGIDVSDSMSLTDYAGVNSESWHSIANNKAKEPGISPLEEALTFTSVAKIKLNLLLQADMTESDAAIEQILLLLKQADSKMRGPNKTDLTRLIKPCLETNQRARNEIKEAKAPNLIQGLRRASSFAAQSAAGLKRLSELAFDKDSQIKRPAPRHKLIANWVNTSDALLQDLKQQGELEVYAFASSTRKTTLESATITSSKQSQRSELGKSTSLYKNLKALTTQSAEGPKLNLLITDGVDSDEAGIKQISHTVRQPLLVLPIGDASQKPDVYIDAVISPTRARHRDKVKFQVEVGHRFLVDETVLVRLKKDGVIIDRTEVLIIPMQSGKAELNWPADTPGEHEFTVEVAPVDNEDLVTNNQKTVTCQVVKDKYRVMLCDGKPRWETRYLEGLFKRDESIEMVNFLFEPRHAFPGKPAKSPIALPLALELWQKFDVVILGDVTPRQFTAAHQEILIKYLNSGGNLIVLAGNDAMPGAYQNTQFAKVLPMLESQSAAVKGTFVISPPEDGKTDSMVSLDTDDQAIWKTLFTMTPQHEISGWHTLKSGARKLLVARHMETGRQYDFMGIQRYGNGRVLFAAAPCLYHLRTIYGDRYHTKFWRKVIRGVCVDNFGFDEGLVKTRLDRFVWKHSEEIKGRLRVTDDTGLPLKDVFFNANLMQDGKIVAFMNPRPDPDHPGDYTLRFTNIEPGDYEIEYEGFYLDEISEKRELKNPDSAVRLSVISDHINPETRHPSETPPFWKQVNDMPLAATVSPRALPIALSALAMQPEKYTVTTKTSIWDVWWLMILIVVIASSEWLLRRLNGLS